MCILKKHKCTLVKNVLFTTLMLFDKVNSNQPMTYIKYHLEKIKEFSVFNKRKSMLILEAR